MRMLFACCYWCFIFKLVPVNSQSIATKSQENTDSSTRGRISSKFVFVTSILFPVANTRVPKQSPRFHPNNHFDSAVFKKEKELFCLLLINLSTVVHIFSETGLRTSWSLYIRAVPARFSSFLWNIFL